MASSINASTSGAGGVITTADATGILNIQTASTTAVTVDASQNVGIGLTPSSWGSGSQAIQNSSGCIWQYGSSNIYLGANYYFNGTNRIYKNSDYATEYQQGSGLHRWFYAASGTAGNTVTLTEAMRIDSSGQLIIGAGVANGSGGINTTSTVADGSLNPALYFNSNYGGGTKGHVYFRRNSSTVGQITENGSTTSYTTTSDYRLKENIVPMTGALEKISQLKPVTYTWKLNGNIGQGFIAHELQAIVPDCVIGDKDDVNEDGSINPQSVDTSFLVATLTAAIQEQQALITSLTARITALEGA